jgi:hypothetical protein
MSSSFYFLAIPGESFMLLGNTATFLIRHGDFLPKESAQMRSRFFSVEKAFLFKGTGMGWCPHGKRATMFFPLFVLLSFWGLPSAAKADLILDQSFTTPSNLTTLINEGFDLVAQTFTAGLTGELAAVTIDVLPTAIAVPPLRVSIYSVSGGFPTSTILASQTLSTVGSDLSNLITFDQPVSIVAGTQYALAVNYPSAPPHGVGQAQGSWGGAVGNLYLGGQEFLGSFSPSGDITWFSFPEDTNFDLHFQTYVSLNVASVPESSTLTLLGLSLFLCAVMRYFRRIGFYSGLHNPVQSVIWFYRDNHQDSIAQGSVHRS